MLININNMKNERWIIMKKAVLLMAIMLTLIILSTGTVFAAENGVEAKADERNPAFEVRGMGDMGGMVVNVNNEDLHFSIMHGHIMIPGNAAENTKSPVFKSMEMESGMVMTHLEPPGRVKQFDHSMH